MNSGKSAEEHLRNLEHTASIGSSEKNSPIPPNRTLVPRAPQAQSKVQEREIKKPPASEEKKKKEAMIPVAPKREMGGGLTEKIGNVIEEMKQLADDLSELAEELETLLGFLNGSGSLEGMESGDTLQERSPHTRASGRKGSGTSSRKENKEIENLLRLAADTPELSQVASLLMQMQGKQKKG